MSKVAIKSDVSLTGNLSIGSSEMNVEEEITSLKNGSTACFIKESYFTKAGTYSVSSGTEYGLDTYRVPDDGYYYVMGEWEEVSGFNGYKLGHIEGTNYGWICSTSVGSSGTGTIATNRMNATNIVHLSAGESLRMLYSHNAGSSVDVKFRWTIVRLA